MVTAIVPVEPVFVYPLLISGSDTETRGKYRAEPHLPINHLHVEFLPILPRIQLHARIHFRHIRCSHRKEELVSEAVALAWKWFVRLRQRGKDPSCFVTTLARYAARAAWSGRRVCGMERPKDVLSPLAQRTKGFTVSGLPDSSTFSANPFSEALRDNTASPVPEQVCFRCDFPAWHATLSRRDRRLVKDMAVGHRTQDLARRYGITPGRVSQRRREFHRDWSRFCGEGEGEGYAEAENGSIKAR